MILSPCCRLKPFGVHVTAVRRSGWGQAGDAAAESLLDAKASWSEMPSLTPEADVIIVACSQDATTRGFVNSAFLSACKAGVVIVNVARGKTQLITVSCFGHDMVRLMSTTEASKLLVISFLSMAIKIVDRYLRSCSMQVAC